MSEFDEPVHDRLAELVRVPQGGRVADLGCGEGPTLAAMACLYPEAHLVGLDRSQKATDAARDHLAHHRGLVELEQTDLRLPIALADGSVDAVVSYNVLECLPDPAEFIAQAARLLKPGGRLVLAHVDFDSIMISGTPLELDRRICHAFADDQQPWMDHANGRIGRAIPGLLSSAELPVERVETLTNSSISLTGHAARRVESMRSALLSAALRGRTEVTTAEVENWYAAVLAAERTRTFFFSETVIIAVSRKDQTGVGS